MTPAELAPLFRQAVADYVGPALLARIDAANAAETDARVCHSHDYCDPNALLLEVWEVALLREFDFDRDEDWDLANAAWILAFPRRGAPCAS